MLSNKYSNETKQKKLKKLAEIEGKSVEELIEIASFDSVVPSICMEPGCDYTTGMEPDQRQGYCEGCGKNTVVSCGVLAGII